MNLDASGTIPASAKIQCLCMLLCGDLVRQIDMFSVEVGSSTMSHLYYIILGLGMHFYPINEFSKKNHVMHCGIRKPLKLKRETTLIV